MSGNSLQPWPIPPEEVIRANEGDPWLTALGQVVEEVIIQGKPITLDAESVAEIEASLSLDDWEA